MPTLNTAIVHSWHAHVYFDAQSRDEAWSLRELIQRELGDDIEMGRFHEKPVGPHPMWSYQLAFGADRLSRVLTWLVLNHGARDVLIHPNSGDELRDHRDGALWLGASHTLDLSVLAG